MFHQLKHNWLPGFGEAAPVRLSGFFSFMRPSWNLKTLETAAAEPLPHVPVHTCCQIFQVEATGTTWKGLVRSHSSCLPSSSSGRPSRSLTLNLCCPCGTQGPGYLAQVHHRCCVIPLQLLASAHWLESLWAPQMAPKKSLFLSKASPHPPG